MSKLIIKIGLVTVFAGVLSSSCKIKPPYYDSNLGYEFDNNDADFVKTAGDFHILKYAPDHTIMITCWYHSNAYKNYTKFLEAAIQIPQQSIHFVADSPVTATSTNFGPLDFINYTTENNNVIYRFSKNVDSLDRRAISNLLFQDSVRFNVGEKQYLFLSKIK